MKKFLMIYLGMLLMSAVTIFAQEVPISPVDQGIISETPPTDFTGVFATFAALVAAIPFVVQLVKKLIPNASSTAVQIVSWVVGIAVTMFGWVFNLGFLAGLDWYIALLYGLGASLAANGVFDTGLIEWVLSLFKKKEIIKVD